MFNPNHKIYLTFDLEEFDIPLEFGGTIDWDEQLQVTAAGLEALLKVLKIHGVTATFFTTGAFANALPGVVKQLSADYEIASHSYHHSSFVNGDLQLSVETLQNITGKKIYGLRMPRMRQVDLNLVKQAGFSYDSSINPTRLPGRYNFSHLPRTAFLQDGLLRIPASVSTPLRIPLFWLAFKNMPLTPFKLLARHALRTDGYLNLYFHPWEFADLSKYKLPAYVKRHSGEPLLNRLNELLGWLKTQAPFDQLHNYAQKKSPLPETHSTKLL